LPALPYLLLIRSRRVIKGDSYRVVNVGGRVVGDGVGTVVGCAHVGPKERVPLRRRPDALERLVEHQRVHRHLLHYRHGLQRRYTARTSVIILFSHRNLLTSLIEDKNRSIASQIFFIHNCDGTVCLL
jgi:hypothetical protein